MFAQARLSFEDRIAILSTHVIPSLVPRRTSDESAKNQAPRRYLDKAARNQRPCDQYDSFTFEKSPEQDQRIEQVALVCREIDYPLLQLYRFRQ